jgi:hypothetical protein
VFGGAGEERPHGADQIGRGIKDGRDQQLIERARDPDRLGAELLLAAGEVVIQRSERCLGLGHDLLGPGGRVALTAHQLGAGVDDPLACRGDGGGHVGL